MIGVLAMQRRTRSEIHRGATPEFLQRYPGEAEVECLLARLGRGSSLDESRSLRVR
jgi:hypothetical protein